MLKGFLVFDMVFKKGFIENNAIITGVQRFSCFFDMGLNKGFIQNNAVIYIKN